MHRAGVVTPTPFPDVSTLQASTPLAGPWGKSTIAFFLGSADGVQSIGALGALLGLSNQTWGGVRDPSTQEEKSCPLPLFLVHPLFPLKVILRMLG